MVVLEKKYIHIIAVPYHSIPTGMTPSVNSETCHVNLHSWTGGRSFGPVHERVKTHFLIKGHI